MTESDWLSCCDPEQMLDFLRGKIIERKFRLFAAASCRRLWSLLEDSRSRNAVEMAERLADGLATPNELAVALRDAGDAHYAVGCAFVEARFSPPENAATAAYYAIGDALMLNACINRAFSMGNQKQTEMTAQAQLLRDIVGNPFRPFTIAPSALAWRNGTVKALADSCYENRILPSGHLDPQRLAILADAAEESGVPDELLAHLRGPGPHVRGCFAVDALSGRV